MKIISFNLRSGGKTGKDNHWQRLIQEFHPDIVCAQESLHPREYLSPAKFPGPRNCVHAFVSHGKWGSAILSRNYQLEAVHLPTFDGSVAGARIPNLPINGAAQPVMIFSVHAPTSPSYEVVVNQILDEVAKVWDRQPLILAGDFNVTTAFRHPSETGTKNSKGECELLSRLRQEFGLVNAWQTLYPNQNLPQTLRWNKNPAVPYHCDAIFVSHHFLPHLESASIANSGEWGSLSDHNPVVVTIT